VRVLDAVVTYIDTGRKCDGRKIDMADKAVEIFRDLVNLDRECFAVMMLTTRNDVIAVEVCHTGGVTESVVDPKVIFKSAIMTFGCVSLVFVHNHPSGNPLPSEDDKRITKKLRECARVLGFTMLDHIIVGEDAHFSFADQGML